MPRGAGRGYSRGFGRGYYRRSFGFYGLIDLLFLIGILYFFVKLFIVAAPYAVGLIALLILREFLRPRLWGWRRPF
ncbi:hypothetical protein, conserved [Thermococcus onnurineus NA1]|uniref:Uncharacterized protein n=1 Tax=Thermococcus onnurineus (strain NA1) TaxID=523850 RepID=B6YWE5_THEON|nr:hypothetical protein [Thermococcus onnurineus]ACJ16408.1 hypothetical protein, conserved [Thermococcus onnurineus NA1]